jgi:protein TonB
MPTRAFLLCSDERAVDAITQTCGELEVSFELFSEPSFAVKRLASQHYDLVMVDCDNEQTGGDAFAAAKKSAVNQASIAIAVVDGKKGVVNAFRLGASLILTKPVSLEQARGTLRNAVAMVRKSSPEAKAPASPPTAPVTAAPAKTESHGVSVSAPVLSAPKPAPASPIKTSRVAPTPIFSKPSDAAKPISSSAGETLPLSKETSLSGKPAKPLALLGDEPLGSSRHPAPPMFGMSESERSCRQTSPFVMAAIAVVLIVVGVYGFSAINPSFHDVLAAQFHKLGVMAGLAPKSQPVATLPTPTPAASAPAVEPVAPAAPAPAAADATPAPSTPDGFSSAATTPSQGFESEAPSKSSAPVILSTSATTAKPASDDDAVVVPEDVSASHIAYQVQPVYPEAAKKKGVKGSVVLNAAVDMDGNVSAVEVANGNPQLASAAVAAVKQWRFQTYYRNGQPTEFQTQVTVQFPQPSRQ